MMSMKSDFVPLRFASILLLTRVIWRVHDYTHTPAPAVSLQPLLFWRLTASHWRAFAGPYPGGRPPDVQRRHDRRHRRRLRRHHRPAGRPEIGIATCREKVFRDCVI